MGRTGRRAGIQPNCTFLTTTEEAAVQAAALLELFQQGFVEPAAPSAWTPHVLAHQLIALAMQEQGVPRTSWWSWLEGCAAFGDLEREERGAIVEHMLRNEILVEADGRLVLGPRGEKLYGARNFLDLYAVFSSPRVLRVLHGIQEVGQVDAFFLQHNERAGAASFVLGGRPWRVVGVDWKKATCAVEPAPSGAYPRWFGRPVLLSRPLCQAIRGVLVGEGQREGWSKRASEAIATQREGHAFLRDEAAPIRAEADGRLRWWTFAGGAGNRVLAELLERALGESVRPANFHVTFSDEAAKSDLALRAAISDLGDRQPLAWDQVVTLLDTEGEVRVSKFQPCLPSKIEASLVAREVMSLDDALRAVAR